MNTKQHDEGDLGNIEIGPIESGVLLPRIGGFIGKLRQILEKLEVSQAVRLLNVSIKQERYIRQRMPTLGKAMEAKFSVRVGDHLRDRSGKRTLWVKRIA